MKKFISEIVIFSTASLFFERHKGVANKLSDAIEFSLLIFIRTTT